MPGTLNTQTLDPVCGPQIRLSNARGAVRRALEQLLRLRRQQLRAGCSRAGSAQYEPGNDRRPLVHRRHCASGHRDCPAGMLRARCFAARRRRPIRRRNAARATLLAPAERRRAPDTVAIALEVAAEACEAAARAPADLPCVFASTHGDLAHQRLHVRNAGEHTHADLADRNFTTPCTTRLLATGALAPDARAYTRYQRLPLHVCCRAAGSVSPRRGRRAQAGVVRGFDIEAKARSAPVAPSRGLLAAALVVAPLAASARWRAVRSASRARPWPRSAATSPRSAALVSDNAMAACLPLFEALARGDPTATVLAAAAQLALHAAAVRARAESSTVDHRVRQTSRCRHPRRRPRRTDAGAPAASSTFRHCDVLVLERRRHPVPEAAHKVGESSVEIGAHYFDTVLGLNEHLTSASSRSSASGSSSPRAASDIDQVTELGASRYLATPSYQLDRGIFENYLAERVARNRCAASSTARSVRSVELGEDGAAHASHRLDAPTAQTHETCTPLADRCIRTRRPDQAQAEPARRTTHTMPTRSGSASARRSTSTNGRSDPTWLARCDPPRALAVHQSSVRRRLLGLADSAVVRLALRRHRLRCRRASARDHEHLREGARMVSPVTSRAWRGRSRASDTCCRTSASCAISRTAASRCSRRRSLGADRRSRRVSRSVLLARQRFHRHRQHLHHRPDRARLRRAARRARARTCIEQLYFSFYESTLSLYTNQYAMFGDPEVMPVKVIWDYTYYWGILCQLFFQHRLTDLACSASCGAELNHCAAR